MKATELLTILMIATTVDENCEVHFTYNPRYEDTTVTIKFFKDYFIGGDDLKYILSKGWRITLGEWSF